MPRLTIQVIDAMNRRPIPFVTVIATSRETGARYPTSTNSSGIAILDLPVGTYDVTVTAFNYEPYRTTVPLTSNRSIRVSLRMVRLF